MLSGKSGHTVLQKLQSGKKVDISQKDQKCTQFGK